MLWEVTCNYVIHVSHWAMVQQKKWTVRPNLKTLPPTTVAFVEHVKCSHRQVLIWKAALKKRRMIHRKYLILSQTLKELNSPLTPSERWYIVGPVKKGLWRWQVLLYRTAVTHCILSLPNNGKVNCHNKWTK